jgi:anti-sigma B factor antagonist
MATPLQIDSRLEGEGSAVLALSGEVDVSNTPQVREAGVKLLAGGGTRLVVDLSGADYMDSAGLGTLVGMLKRVKEAGGVMAIAGPQPRVRRLFEITGLDQIFSIYQDLDTAMKEVRA